MLLKDYRIIKGKEDNVKYIGVLSNIIFEDECKIKEDKEIAEELQDGNQSDTGTKVQN